MNKHILLVEDDTAFGMMLQKWMKRNGYDATLCDRMKEAQKLIARQSFHLILTDLRLPDGDGILLLQWIRESKLVVPVMVMTSYGEIQTAVAAIKFGALDYLEKPIVPSILKEKIDQALRVNPAEKKASKKLEPRQDMVMGSSAVARKMYDQIHKVAPTRFSVLILGESGTGKEYIARMIHAQSTRSEKPFIAVDCGSLSRELAPSELFGHLKGSFTSAFDNKTGVFEQANEGTVFLDEVGNLSYEVQIQLLRTLQEQKIRRVGSATDTKVDVRILAATNENLEIAIAEGRFREDLYHRLNEFSVLVPPLRERKEDIAEFAGEFLRQANLELDKQVQGFDPVVIEKFQYHQWSGNLRELRNMVRRLVLFASGDTITTDDLPELSQPSVNDMQWLQSANEKEQIENALRIARGNKSQAARLLNVDRKTLYNKMHQYGLKL
ncbi:MAG: sigma-54 dependent transcriptional regulator [Bacteroidales bacterium]|jgi:two-component system response regulator HydG|nr:sigma-54 dependent transcriptional regulator [Bacteroidales bacterium]